MLSINTSGFELLKYALVRILENRADSHGGVVGLTEGNDFAQGGFKASDSPPVRKGQVLRERQIVKLKLLFVEGLHTPSFMYSHQSCTQKPETPAL